MFVNAMNSNVPGQHVPKENVNESQFQGHVNARVFSGSFSEPIHHLQPSVELDPMQAASQLLHRDQEVCFEQSLF